MHSLSLLFHSPLMNLMWWKKSLINKKKIKMFQFPFQKWLRSPLTESYSFITIMFPIRCIINTRGTHKLHSLIYKVIHSNLIRKVDSVYWIENEFKFKLKIISKSSTTENRKLFVLVILTSSKLTNFRFRHLISTL